MRIESNELIYLFRELDMNAQLIIQMKGKTTGILNCKVSILTVSGI